MTTLHHDENGWIYSDANNMIHVVTRTGCEFTPSHAMYPGFTPRDFPELRRELSDSGLPADIVARWMSQAEGHEFS